MTSVEPGDNIADFDNADRAKRGNQNVGYGEDHICKADDLEILCALCNDIRIIGKQREQLCREKQHDCKHQNGQCAAKAKRYADDVRDRLQLALAPILRTEHNRTLTCANDQHLQQVLYLVAQADATHSILAVSTKHNGVHHVDTIGQQVLQRQ